MERKIITGVSCGLLFAAFAVVSVLVIITKRNPYFVAKKLRLGALILSISGASIGCPTTTCYEPVAPNIIQIDQPMSLSDSIVVNKTLSNSIIGKISEREGNLFSYALVDSLDEAIFKDNILPIDSVFDERVEEFKIDLDSAIVPGQYQLRFFYGPKDSIQNLNWFLRSFPLTVTQ